jgi:hypothetical protein
VSQALTENAPVTLLNYPGGHHAFEIVDNAEATRAVIDRTIAFVKEATRPDYQESLRRAAPVAFAASLVMARKYADAARPRDLGIPAAYACMQKGDPDAAIAWLASIPKRFRPTELQQDPIFAPIRTRQEFVALF